MTIETISAIIYLKDGRRKHGMLIEKSIDGMFQFISNCNYFSFEQTQNEKYIEHVPVNSIALIDTYLK